jgi:hypothetical protein
MLMNECGLLVMRCINKADGLFFPSFSDSLEVFLPLISVIGHRIYSVNRCIVASVLNNKMNIVM